MPANSLGTPAHSLGTLEMAPRITSPVQQAERRRQMWRGSRGEQSVAPSVVLLPCLALLDAQVRVVAAQELQQRARDRGAHAPGSGSAHPLQVSNLCLLAAVAPAGQVVRWGQGGQGSGTLAASRHRASAPAQRLPSAGAGGRRQAGTQAGAQAHTCQGPAACPSALPGCHSSWPGGAPPQAPLQGRGRHVPR